MLNTIVNWGIIAPGKIAYRFAKGLENVGGANLYAVASRDAQKAMNFARQFAIKKHYGSYAELLNDEALDAVYIAAPNHLHHKLTLQALDQKKAVLCEKPIAINSSQVKEMINCAERNNTFLMEALWTRFLPHMMHIKQHFDKGIYSNIEFIDSFFCFKGAYDLSNRLYNPALGGGTLLDIGIYPVFLNYLLLGKPREIIATAIKAPSGVDETLQVTFNYDKASARFLTSFKFEANNDAYIYFDGGKVLHIGKQFHGPVNYTVGDSTNDKKLTKFFEHRGNGYNYQVEEVNNCLAANRLESPLWTWQNSLDIMAIMDEIRAVTGVKYPYD